MIPRLLLLLILFGSLPEKTLAHGNESASPSGGGSRKKEDRPRHKSESAALEELAYLIRDMDKRLRRGDIEGVHQGAWEIAVTADNLWVLGEKKKDRATNRMTINGYMNLLKSAARELESYAGNEELEAGRAQLARVKEIFALLHNQYHPGHENAATGRTAPDSGAIRPVPESGGKALPDSIGPVSPR